MLHGACGSFADALETLADLTAGDAEGRTDEDQTACPWNRARYDALNLRDRLARAVPADFDQDHLDEQPGDVIADLMALRKARFRSYPR